MDTSNIYFDIGRLDRRYKYTSIRLLNLGINNSATAIKTEYVILTFNDKNIQFTAQAVPIIACGPNNSLSTSMIGMAFLYNNNDKYEQISVILNAPNPYPNTYDTVPETMRFTRVQCEFIVHAS